MCLRELYGYKSPYSKYFRYQLYLSLKLTLIICQCVVQSYLQWLQDSDYNSICELCSNDLNIEDSIRLTCYRKFAAFSVSKNQYITFIVDVFHWSCLDHYSRQLPPTTAPRGYVCPSCKNPLFPAPNLISPVADVLKEKLAGVNWARAGLGLPLVSKAHFDQIVVSNQCCFSCQKREK